MNDRALKSHVLRTTGSRIFDRTSRTSQVSRSSYVLLTGNDGSLSNDDVVRNLVDFLKSLSANLKEFTLDLCYTSDSAGDEHADVYTVVETLKDPCPLSTDREVSSMWDRCGLSLVHFLSYSA